jgi:hypothetical protein
LREKKREVRRKEKTKTRRPRARRASQILIICVFKKNIRACCTKNPGFISQSLAAEM